VGSSALSSGCCNFDYAPESDLDSRSPWHSNLFEIVADLGDVSEPKPSPEVYLLAAARLALPPSKCMVVEDALTGVLSAKRAGFCVSALTRTFAAHELIEARANFTFQDFLSLKRFLNVSEREAPRDYE
jgi:beta-phosphoglucomutase-like phosphatase (HAD superfamily)